MKLVQGELAGVLVVSMPPLACALRDFATRDRYRALSPRDAAVMLNREVRIISRVVIEPRFRGCGLAVELVRRALAQPAPGVAFSEALAAMGRVSPFFERAGMTRFDPPNPRCRPDRARLIDAIESVCVQKHNNESLDLIDAVDRGPIPRIEQASPALKLMLLQRHLNQCDPSQLAWLMRELRLWHRRAHRTPKSTLNRMTIDELLAAAADELRYQPVYYLYRHDVSAF